MHIAFVYEYEPNPTALASTIRILYKIHQALVLSQKVTFRKVKQKMCWELSEKRGTGGGDMIDGFGAVS